ncbi:MAG: hypothetical protein NTW87_20390 [Planctomycetota bacterium]|nr:hypothetical protein [Planctomycetota bacterium]
MTEPLKPSLFRRIVAWDRAKREEMRTLARASAGFDLRFARALLTLCVPLTVPNIAPFGPALEWTAAIGTGAFAILLCAYFAWILFRRLQCSLLELIALVAFLGNVVGIALTTPNLSGLAPGAWALTPLLAGWVFYGMVLGLTQARLLGVHSPLPRLLLLAANWYGLAAPALLLAGVLLHFGGSVQFFVSRAMAAWGVPLILLGVAGYVVAIWLGIKTRRAARTVLAS